MDEQEIIVSWHSFDNNLYLFVDNVHTVYGTIYKTTPEVKGMNKIVKGAS